MDITEAIKSRRAIRKFKDEALSNEHVKKIDEIIKNAVPLVAAIPTRFELINDSKLVNGTILKGIIGGYGRIKAPSCLLCIGEKQKHVRENIGFMGEQIVIELAKLGIGTCWVASGYDKEKSKQFLKKDREEISIVIVLGYPAEKDAIKISNAEINIKRRKELKEFVSKNSEGTNELTPMENSVLELCRLYPSAVNFQPVKVIINSDKMAIVSKPTAIIKKTKAHLIDGGIFSAHMYLALKYYGLDSTFTIENSDAISKLNLSKGTDYIVSFKQIKE